MHVSLYLYMQCAIIEERLKSHIHTYIHTFSLSPPVLCLQSTTSGNEVRLEADHNPQQSGQHRPQSQLPAGQASLISRHHSDITGESTAVQIENTEFIESNQNLCQDLQSLTKKKKKSKSQADLFYVALGFLRN